MTPTSPVSAGALPWRVGEHDILEVLLVHRRKHQDWAIPKGNVEPGESDRTCARRELREETGLDCRLGWELPSLHYRTPTREPKTARFWAATVRSGTFTPSSEIDQTRWFPFATAIRVLTKPRERAIPLALAARLHARGGTSALAGRQRTVLLVRGGSATPREDWPHADDTRPLTERGTHAARSLLALGTVFDVQQVFSSPASRCVDTVAPLARSQARTVQVFDHLSDGDPRGALDLVDRARGTGTVLCTHEDVINGVLDRLAARDRTTLETRSSGRRGSVWALTGDQHRYTAAYYLPMPHPTPISRHPSTPPKLDPFDVDTGAA